MLIALLDSVKPSGTATFLKCARTEKGIILAILMFGKSMEGGNEIRRTKECRDGFVNTSFAHPGRHRVMNVITKEA